jgi:hypothetical protein
MMIEHNRECRNGGDFMDGIQMGIEIIELGSVAGVVLADEGGTGQCIFRTNRCPPPRPSLFGACSSHAPFQ